MNIKPLKAFGVLVLLSLTASANAASVSLVPTTAVDDVLAGDVVSFDIMMDFTGEATIGGGFDIVFDENALQFDSVNRNLALGEPDFSRDPTPGPGLLDDWVVSAFNALPETANMGSVNFTVLPGLGGGTTNVTLTDGRDGGAVPSLAGFWVDAIDFTSEIAVDYNSVAVNGFAAVADTDNDGVLDDTDNCTLVPNADQRDTDGDLIGNICDADLNNDCVVNAADLGILRTVFFTADSDADFNGNGFVNVVDLGIMKASFFTGPGPGAPGNICEPQ